MDKVYTAIAEPSYDEPPRQRHRRPPEPAPAAAHSLEILDRITEIAPPGKTRIVAARLRRHPQRVPDVTDFEREFPSLCFALATGVGKTRLMGAFISYLHLAHGIDNFFVLAPNLTIYNKLIADFTPNTPKYVFKGIAEFATDAARDHHRRQLRAARRVRGTLFDDWRATSTSSTSPRSTREVRGGKAPRIKRLSEYIGESYFDYLAGLPDLVLLMDESHRYRASAGVRAINELKPILGLELTATPFVETGTRPGAVQECHLRLSAGRGDGRRLRQGAGRRHAQELQPQRHVDRGRSRRLKLEDGVRVARGD